jgi:sugar O-acyltransferase (sialic acid O-acetyltransferase NeuD family)
MILYIYCAGGFGKEVKDIAQRRLETGRRWSKLVFVDDVLSVDQIYGCSVKTLANLVDSDSISSGEFVVANGEPAVRDRLYRRLENLGAKLSQVIDGSTLVSPTSSIEPGVIVAPLCSISSNAHLMLNSSINTMSIIGHDVTIGRHSVISSMVNLGGACSVGGCSYVGMGTLVKEGVNIGSNSIIGMGSVVYTDIPDGVIALGNPARVARRNVDQKVFKSN